MKTTMLPLTILAAASLTACGAEDPRASAESQLSTSQEGAHANSPAANKLLAKVRQETKQFQDPQNAIDAGYHSEEECISAADLGAPAELGAMGIHFVNEELLDENFDPLKPEVLVYEPVQDGTLQLVAVEYLAIGDEPEPFAGEVHFHPFHPPFADWELHAWVWRGNPNGKFADFNPTVSCPDHD